VAKPIIALADKLGQFGVEPAPRNMLRIKDGRGHVGMGHNPTQMRRTQASRRCECTRQFGLVSPRDHASAHGAVVASHIRTYRAWERLGHAASAPPTGLRYCLQITLEIGQHVKRSHRRSHGIAGLLEQIRVPNTQSTRCANIGSAHFVTCALGTVHLQSAELSFADQRTNGALR